MFTLAQSGAELEADIVVSATGRTCLRPEGCDSVPTGARSTCQRRCPTRRMLSGVPNFAGTIGYTNTSWTLKADLVAEYVCRLCARSIA